MTDQQKPLFDATPPPKCERCDGTGRTRDYDGENQDCPACLGTGREYDPETVDWPEGY